MSRILKGNSPTKTFSGHAGRDMLGHFWEMLGHFWDMLGHIWDMLGHIWDVLGHIWDMLGHIWDMTFSGHAGSLRRGVGLFIQ